ncbi:maleylacetate reductase [Boeremia exigua]|uniref:maleylacetate reductase n=1 Tax=Boeremia exigua TaxID=749465 RepID=UPI001E8EC31A|nr:maleylacetate reductase [Boeremia exigua]KAH6615188.1 maleylacetate reductase [Boeremia exigua]
MAAWFADVETCRPAFDVKSTPRITHGLRFPDACAQHINGDLACNSVFVIASASLSRNTDALDRLTDALGDKVAGVHVGVSSHTPIDEVAAIVAKVKDLHIDCLVCLGAGSITDAAKVIRFALANTAFTVADIRTLRGARPHKHNLPSITLVCIPTTLSGGEYQGIAGVTDNETREKMLFDPIRDPDLVIQDPELCSTTPQRIWLSTGIRSVDHCVETLCSLQSNDTADDYARRGLPRLVEALIHCKEDARNLEAIHQCQVAVTDAMRAVSCGVPMGASHAVGHQLGPLGVPHGETSCIMLPAVCSFNTQEPANLQKQAQIVRILLDTPAISGLLKTKGVDPANAQLAEILDIFLRHLGMPRTLKEVGIEGGEKLRQLAKNSLQDHWIKTNAIPITEESQMMELLALVT